MNSTVKFIRSILSSEKKLQIIFASVIILAIVALAVSGYAVFLERKEKALSWEVNRLVKDKNDVLEEYDAGTLSAEDYTNKLTDLSEEFFRVYQDAPSTQNGHRSLITAAEIDMKLDRMDLAEERLLIVSEDGNEMSPLARYLLALIYEGQGEYQKGLDVLKEFATVYGTHYLRPMALFTEARLHKYLGARDQAILIYSDILKNQDFSPFFESVEQEMDLLELERIAEGGAPLEDGLAPEFGAGLTPDYLQNTN